MGKVSLVILFSLALNLSAMAATVEYQGIGGNLNAPGSWYVITDPAVPASHTGATGLPVAGDYGIIRGPSGTVGFTLLGERLDIGGPQITGVTTLATSTVTVPAGGSMHIYRGLPMYGAQMDIGGYYNGTLNISGGTVRTGWGALATVVNVGHATGSTGTINLSSGLLDIQNVDNGVPQFLLGAAVNGTGIMNITGGSVKIDAVGSTSRGLRIGSNGSAGRLNISGGTLMLPGTADVGTGTSMTPQSTGVITQTGGFVSCDFRTIVGEDNGFGHYKMLGGTYYSQWLPGNPGPGQLWVGRFKTLEPAEGFKGKGKFTMNQSAYLNIDGIHMGTSGVVPAIDADHTQMEVKINSMNPFQFNSVRSSYLNGKLEISFTDGFQPQVGNVWKLMSYDTGNVGADMTVDFTQITPGFILTKHDKAIWIECTGVRHAGDANNDGKVNVGDLGILAGNWGQTDIFGKEWAQGDFNGDDVVNVGDLGILAGAWNWIGTPASSTSVPEPASLVLLVLGGLAMLRRRK